MKKSRRYLIAAFIMLIISQLSTIAINNSYLGENTITMGFHIGTSRWAGDSDTLLESSVATSVVETMADPNNDIDDELETELEWNTEANVKYTGEDNQHRGDYTVSTQINGIVDDGGGDWVGELEERAGFRMTLKPKPSNMDIDIEDCRAYANATRKEWGWIFDNVVEETISKIPFQ